MGHCLQVDSSVPGFPLPPLFTQEGEEFAELARRLWPVTIVQPVGRQQALHPQESTIVLRVYSVAASYISGCLL